MAALTACKASGEGEAVSTDGSKTTARLSAGKVLDGCGVAAVLNTEDRQVFIAIGYVDRYERWVTFQLDDLPGSLHRYSVSKQAGAGAIFEDALALSIKDEFSLYVMPEAFNTEAALQRTVWETLNDNEVVFRTEERASAEDDWRPVISYSLTRR